MNELYFHTLEGIPLGAEESVTVKEFVFITFLQPVWFQYYIVKSHRC